ncbi:right-handed parallel beta-helix repeat-containing protein, partial [bacterium]|nr:right-handed parallel beta-helix repeat-containing protein [bacterium]
PIRIYANYVPAIGQGNTAQDNGTDAIEVLGDNITSSVTWIDAQMPYAIAGDVVVFSPAIGDTLTLEPGVTLSFNPEVELQLGKDGHPGTLLALGKPDSAITFTSSAEKASPGDWAGIFCDSLGTGILDSCIVEYGGYGAHDANIYVVPGGSATLTQCTIRQSDGAGIKCWAAGATAQVTGCLITANQIGFLGNEATLSVHYSHIYDNLVYGGQNGTIADTIDATGNWWGDPTGPRDTSLGPPSYNPNGLGDRVTDYVAYDPWWDATLPGLSTLILSDPLPTTADSVVFTLTFSRKMDPTADPLVTFGLASPFDSLAVVADTGWAADSLSWTGSFVITDSTGDGLNTIAVSGARDIWGWTMETDTAYTLFIDTRPPGSQASSPAISPADTFLVSWTTDDPLPSSGIAGVTVYVSENDSDWVAWLSDATDTCALYPGQDEHTYFFYAVATDSAGNAEDTAAAAECTTYVDASAPLVPAMLLPADGAVVADTLPIFTWSPVTKAGGKTTTGRTNRRGGETEGTPVEYHLQCAVDDLFDSLLVDQESLTDTSYTPDAFNDGLYYWRVAASDGAGHHSGFPATPFSFQVDTQPPAITGTTVWPDTSFPGPFPVTADITDKSDIT